MWGCYTMPEITFYSLEDHSQMLKVSFLTLKRQIKKGELEGSWVGLKYYVTERVDGRKEKEERPPTVY